MIPVQGWYTAAFWSTTEMKRRYEAASLKATSKRSEMVFPAASRCSAAVR